MTDILPARPFEAVSADLFYYGGRAFLVYADRLSGYPLVAEWTSDPSSRQVIQKIRGWFTSMGIPVKFRSDGGPQFKAKEFQTFLEEYGVTWSPSSPHHAQSNGFAEVLVKTMKNALKKTGANHIEDMKFMDFLME